MQKLRECIHRMRLKQSLREINKELSVHRLILRKLKIIATEQGWLDPTAIMPSDYEINRFWENTVAKKQSQKVALDPFFEEIKKWVEQDYTGIVIHRLLSEKTTCSIWQVRRYLYKKFPKHPEPVMTRFTIPGDIMDVDFGFLGLFWDSKTKKFRKTWIFSGRLRHSRKVYRKVVFNQKVGTFIQCHIDAFESFEGVPVKVVLDNLKAGVIKSCIDNDLLNRSYQDMAEHYKVMLSPCLPCTPEHKGGVENDISYIKKSFLPIVKEKQKQQSHLDLFQLQDMLEKWDQEIANVRIVYGVGKSPKELFEYEEKHTLQALPAYPFEIVEWHEYLIRKDWRIMYDYIYYSVPYYLIGKTVQICASSRYIRVFCELQEVAKHTRGTQKWEYIKNINHSPPFKEIVLSCTREGLLEQSKEIGPYTYAWIEKVLNNPIIDKLRPVRSLLALTISYSKERIEKACERALHYNAMRYQSVKNILEKGLDQEPFKQENTKIYSFFKHARNPSEYQTKPIQKEASHG